MQLKNIVVVAKREYLQRAKTKAFWITTLILPLFVTAVSTCPPCCSRRARPRQKIVVVDETGKVGSALVAKMNSGAPEKPKTGKESTARRGR